jgi:A/G-specific adenine glycosylase
MHIIAAMSAFGKQLISWYGKNKRSLPWRDTDDPYLIWLSEVILQQTRVDQGMSYYLRFSEQFPDVHSLAAAPLEQVLKLWQGLGYYSRARNLHATAQIISSELKGFFPKTKSEMMKLKGIGDYTASAIASFCFGESVPVIDGNVIRVLSRLHAIEHPVDSPQGKSELRKVAEKLLDQHDPGTYNQAIMEFGALQCTPVNPNCERCPFMGSCRAFAMDAVSAFPVKKKKASVKEMPIQYFILYNKTGLYLRKRGNDSIWKGLYDFPSLEKSGSPDEVLRVFQDLHGFPSVLGLKHVTDERRHLLTHRRISARFFELEFSKQLKNLPSNWSFVSFHELKAYPVPRLIEKYLAERFGKF